MIWFLAIIKSKHPQIVIPKCSIPSTCVLSWWTLKLKKCCTRLAKLIKKAVLLKDVYKNAKIVKQAWKENV